MTTSWKVIYKVNPQRNNQFSFYVTNGAEVRQIGLIEFPADNQIGESIKTADAIVVELRKRIRRAI